MAEQTFTMEIEGLKELQSQLKQVPEKIKKNELYRILRNVTGPVEDAMRHEVAQIQEKAFSEGRPTTGNLYDAIGRIRGKSQEFVNIQVAPRAKRGFKGGHAHLVNFGTKVRATRTGANRGAARENNFSERAYNKTRSAVTLQMEKQIAKSTERLLKKNIIPKY